ncbi:hypothetical protein [Opitutus sp. ER46]|uniref:hypothetical protein n=1 Tax=Opitutus sp. ER46 TaxID=2161864 RepID=UPI000D2FB906|nr:hypothetical protein [Opitutus sp. ER46]PTX97913.1 hypothetical protein DB354_06445 [Opitutus sp. ER46]
MPLRKIPQTQGPKINLHGRGTGGFTKGDVERRAKELAEIDNRLVVSNEDRERARAELLDRHLPEALNEDADTSRTMSRDPSDPASSRGHQVPNYIEADEETSLQRLALDGVEEAQHDQMTAARSTEEPFRSQPKSRSRRRPPGQS